MARGVICPQCGKGLLRVRSSLKVGQYQKQYGTCTNPNCGHKATMVVAEGLVYRRKR